MEADPIYFIFGDCISSENLRESSDRSIISRKNSRKSSHPMGTTFHKIDEVFQVIVSSSPNLLQIKIRFAGVLDYLKFPRQ